MPFLRRLFSLRYTYPNPLDQRRAMGMFFLTAAGLSIWFVWFAFFGLQRFADNNVRISDYVILAAPLLTIVFYTAIQTGRLSLAAWIIVGGFLLATPGGILNRGVDTNAMIVLVMPVIIAGLLLRRRGLLFVTGLVMMVILLAVVAEYGSLEGIGEANAIGSLLIVLLIGLSFAIFVGNPRTLMEATQQEVSQLRLISQFNIKAPRDDEIGVYRALINMVRRDMAYNFAQVFILDDTGRISQRLRVGLISQLGLDVIETTTPDASALMNAALSRTSVLVTATADEPQRGHLLPSSAYGLAIPLMYEDRVYAVLDVQDNIGAFSDTQVETLEVLGIQAGAFIYDVRQIKALREMLADQEVTVANLRRRLRTARGATRSVVAGDWETYLNQRGQAALGFDMNMTSDATIIPAADLPEAMRQSLNEGKIMTAVSADEQTIIVPILMQGSVFGVMSFTVPTDHTISKRQAEMAQQVAARLALALENKRLFEQSQSQALRERKANEIGNLLLSATEVDAVLSLAANSFNEALGAIQTRIHIQPDALLDMHPDAADVPVSITSAPADTLDTQGDDS